MEKTLVNISIDEFKKIEGVDKVEIIDHPKFKLFASCSNGKKFKAQGNLDVTKPVEFLHEEDNWNEGCFFNANKANVILSL